MIENFLPHPRYGVIRQQEMVSLASDLQAGNESKA